ncbi:MAG: hypothetical protein ABW172_16785, partial [Candidatus Binatia bacterium]
MNLPAWDMPQPTPWGRLIATAALAAVLDAAIYYGLFAIGLDTERHLLSFSLATAAAYGLMARGVFASIREISVLSLYGRSLIVFLLTLFFRGLLFAHLLETSDWPTAAALLTSAFAGQLFQLVGVMTVVF